MDTPCLGLPYHKQHQSMSKENNRSTPLRFTLGDQGIGSPQRSWEQEGRGIHLSWCLAEAGAVAPAGLWGATTMYENSVRLQQPSQLRHWKCISRLPEHPAVIPQGGNDLPAVCVRGAHKRFLKTYPEPQRWTGPGAGALGLVPTGHGRLLMSRTEQTAVGPARAQQAAGTSPPASATGRLEAGLWLSEAWQTASRPCNTQAIDFLICKARITA